MEELIHTIPPVYDSQSKILILGSFPSPKSREQGFFYGHPQNRFWRVLSAVLQKALPVTVEEKKALLLENGIALWDVLHACEIEGADDSTIKNVQANDLNPILQTAPIRAVCTTGGKAAALYQKFLGPKIGLPFVMLPSTSPANCSWKFDRLCDAYQVLITYLEDTK